MTTKAVLLCGGLATRLLPITKSIPKEMLPILNRPAIDYCIEDLKKNGITNILIVLGRNKETLENYFDRNIELEQRLQKENKQEQLKLISEQHTDVNITFIRQIDPKGTGYATNLAKEFVGSDNFVLLFPDDIIIGDSLCKQLLTVHNQTGGNVIPVKRININECNKYGMVGITTENNNLKVTQFVEKPTIDETPSDVCYTGGGLFTPEIFDYLADCQTHENGEKYLTDTFSHLSAKNSLYGIEIKGTRLDIGTPLGFLQSNILAGLNSPDSRNEIIKFIKSLNI